MTDTQPTEGPWIVETAPSGVICVRRDNRAMDEICDLYYLENAEANAHLIARLANLYFAGTARAEKRTADVLAKGDIPPNLDYGLTENEIAAASMMNALMDENAELLGALIAANGCLRPTMDEETNAAHERAEAAIAKAKGDS